MMDEVALAELAADIKAESQREPIHLWQDQIIDGRNRYKACQIAGVEPIFKRIEFPGEQEALAYVVSRNLKRRHLNAPQRTEVIRRLRTLPQWRDASNVEIARQIGVSEATVRRAHSSEQVGGLSASHDADAPQAIENTQPASQHTVTIKRGEQEYRTRVEAKPTLEPAPERPKPESHPADVMGRMRMNAQRLSGASLAALIATWITARVEVSVAIGSRADIMTQLGGGVAARSSISKWVRDDDVSDAQRASLVKETIAAMNPVERDKLIEEIVGGVAKPAPLYRERI